MDAENAVSNLSSPPVVTSSPNTSEFEPQVQVVKHFVSEETRAKIDDAQTTPPIIHTNVSFVFSGYCLYSLSSSVLLRPQKSVGWETQMTLLMSPQVPPID